MGVRMNGTHGGRTLRGSRDRMSFMDVCSGAGGLALGLEQAGFEPVLLIDVREVACKSLEMNRPGWDVRQTDLRKFDPVNEKQFYDIDLVSAGLPRVPATAAKGNARSSTADENGTADEVRLVKATTMLLHAVQPRAMIIENVPDLVTQDTYLPIRQFVQAELNHLGYRYMWFVINAADHRVPQDRKQGILIALKGDLIERFTPPPRVLEPPVTVGDALLPSMAARGWRQAAEWAAYANRLAPTIVGGSWNRGGGDLGPSGTKAAWRRMGVNGASLADEVPSPDFCWHPNPDRGQLVRLTIDQAATLQGFPPDWQFAGKKTARYRQVGNATPPPVARALGEALRNALLDGASM